MDTTLPSTLGGPAPWRAVVDRMRRPVFSRRLRPSVHWPCNSDCRRFISRALASPLRCGFASQDPELRNPEYPARSRRHLGLRARIRHRPLPRIVDLRHRHRLPVHLEPHLAGSWEPHRAVRGVPRNRRADDREPLRLFRRRPAFGDDPAVAALRSPDRARGAVLRLARRTGRSSGGNGARPGRGVAGVEAHHRHTRPFQRH